MFKPCKGCPTPAKCKKMGACAAKMKKPTAKKPARGSRTATNRKTKK